MEQAANGFKMNKHTWKATRWKSSYFVSVTADEVICYVRDADDVEEQFEIPTEYVSRCGHQAFRGGELQDWVLLHLGDEVLMEILAHIYTSGISADQIERNDRTIYHWQMLPIDLMLSEVVNSAEDNGYNHFAMGPNGSTEATLPSGAHLTIPLHARTATLTRADGTTQSLAIPAKVMYLLPYAGHFYLSGESVIVISEQGRTTYATAQGDAQRYQLGTLFKTGNLYRSANQIALTFQAIENVTSDVFELTGRKGYFALHPSRGIIGWQLGA